MLANLAVILSIMWTPFLAFRSASALSSLSSSPSISIFNRCVKHKCPNVTRLLMTSADSSIVRSSIWNENSEGKLVILILNCPLDGNVAENYLRKQWDSASYRICADGGANRLFDLFKLDSEREKYVPDTVRGDLDSLRPEVSTYYRNQGATIITDSNQDSNDFEKCLKDILCRFKDSTTDMTLIALNSFGGRLDQEMGAFHLLYKYTNCFKHFALLGEKSFSFLISPGRVHRIIPDSEHEGKHCGLVPLGVPCSRISTTGLKWNLNGSRLEMGSFVSTSNEVAATEVTVESCDPVLWCVDLKGSGTEEL